MISVAIPGNTLRLQDTERWSVTYSLVSQTGAVSAKLHDLPIDSVVILLGRGIRYDNNEHGYCIYDFLYKGQLISMSGFVFNTSTWKVICDA